MDMFLDFRQQKFLPSVRGGANFRWDTLYVYLNVAFKNFEVDVCIYQEVAPTIQLII